MQSNYVFQIVEVIKEDNGGTYRLGCSIGGGIDQDEMMNPFNQGFFLDRQHFFDKNFRRQRNFRVKNQKTFGRRQSRS